MVLLVFDRLELLIEKNKLEEIKTKKILIVGVGGVGGFVAEALVRTGVYNITLIDNDIVSISNKNRQIIALDSTIGKSKVEVLKERLTNINKEVKVRCFNIFLDKNTIDLINIKEYDYVVDCCDFIEAKKLLIQKTLDASVKFISCMGTGKRLDPSKLMITDLTKTSYDPVARILRKYIRDLKIKEKIFVCFSSETPKKIDSKEIASAIFVPASAGILIASYIIRDFIHNL